MQFKQSGFLKKYIDHCTSKRAQAKSEFRIRLYKDLANSCFGKFIENIRDRLECKFVKTKKHFEKWVTNARFAGFKILAPGLVVIFLRPRWIVMKQAWAIGFTILERSKGLVFDHFYNFIMPSFNNDLTLLFTDTDSLAFAVGENAPDLSIMKVLSPIMDFSNYKASNALYNPKTKNKLSLWKDELKGENLLEFVGLSSKTYAMRQSGGEVSSKCKGVGRAFKKSIPFASYKECVTSISSHRMDLYTIRSNNHQLRTLKNSKRLCFSSFDDKRYILNCGIHSIPYYYDMSPFCTKCGI